MRLNKLLKKYRKMYRKTSNLYEKIMKAYKEAYMGNDVSTTQELYNTIYSNNLKKKMKQILSSSTYGLSVYDDTDSIADGMKYTE